MNREQLSHFLSETDKLLTKQNEARILLLALRERLWLELKANENGHTYNQIEGVIRIDGKVVAYSVLVAGERQRVDLVPWEQDNYGKPVLKRIRKPTEFPPPLE